MIVLFESACLHFISLTLDIPRREFFLITFLEGSRVEAWIVEYFQSMNYIQLKSFGENISTMFQ